MRKKIVVVYGQSGCGKTVNKQRIADFFGLNRIDDHCMERIPEPLIEGTLYLTNDIKMAKKYEQYYESYESVIARIDICEIKLGLPKGGVKRKSKSELISDAMNTTNEAVKKIKLGLIKSEFGD